MIRSLDMNNDKPAYKFSRAQLAQRLQGLPMLRVLLPFACGIVLAMHYTLPIGYLGALLLFCGIATLITRRAIYTFCLLVVAGVLNVALREVPAELPIGQRASFRIRVETPVALRKGFGDGEGSLTAWRDPQTGVWHAAQGGLLLRADSLTQLAPGEEICFEGRIYPLRGGSPSYRRLMHSRGVIGRCYLNERNILSRETTDKHTLHQRAAATLAQLPESHRAGLAVVRAMTVGDRSDLSRDLRNSYSQSGMSHLLAISGLHTGMVFMLLNLLLYWMPMLRYGGHLRNMLTIIALWLFVAGAGFPPSAVRAAVMCTLLQWSLNSTSAHQSLNTWATAAVGMLVWEPRWIVDIGFQLSFLAVAAILAWGIPLGRQIRLGNRFVNYLSQGYAIALTASIATAPLIAHTFGIISPVGILISPFVVLLGMGIVAIGLLLLLIPPLREYLAPLGNMLGEWLNQIAVAATSLEGGHLEVTLSTTAMVIIYLLMGLLTLIGWSVVRKKGLSLSHD